MQQKKYTRVNFLQLFQVVFHIRDSNQRHIGKCISVIRSKQIFRYTI